MELVFLLFLSCDQHTHTHTCGITPRLLHRSHGTALHPRLATLNVGDGRAIVNRSWIGLWHTHSDTKFYRSDSIDRAREQCGTARLGGAMVDRFPSRRMHYQMKSPKWEMVWEGGEGNNPPEQPPGWTTDRSRSAKFYFHIEWQKKRWSRWVGVWWGLSNGASSSAFAGATRENAISLNIIEFRVASCWKPNKSDDRRRVGLCVEHGR